MAEIIKTWGNDVIRLVCISDTHGKVGGDIPAGDVVIHGGDFSRTGTLPELKKFRAVMDKLPHKQKIVIAGNHDITL